MLIDLNANGFGLGENDVTLTFFTCVYVQYD